MKALAKVIGLTLVAAALVHVCVVWSVPYLVMLHLERSSATTPNRIYFGERVTARTHDVVRPSPDLLYAACPFDLSAGPLRVTARVPKSYFSIAAFADNTDNFFVVNDQQIAADTVSLLLVRKAGESTPLPAERLVVAPTDRGVLLFRTLIDDPANLDALVAIQRAADCRTAGP